MNESPLSAQRGNSRRVRWGSLMVVGVVKWSRSLFVIRDDRKVGRPKISLQPRIRGPPAGRRPTVGSHDPAAAPPSTVSKLQRASAAQEPSSRAEDP